MILKIYDKNKFDNFWLELIDWILNVIKCKVLNTKC